MAAFWIRLTGLVLAIGAAGTASGEAALISFADTNFTTNGSASFVSAQKLQITNDYDQAGSAFTDTAFSTADSFAASFTYSLQGIYTHDPAAPQADGIAFVVQSDVRGSSALGPDGGQLGYGGIGPSVAVLFSSWFTDRLRISTGGDILSGPSVPFALGGNPSDTGTVHVAYDALAHLLTVIASPTAGASITLSASVDFAALLGPEAFFGFTGATQIGGSTQTIGDFTVARDVPEPIGLLVVVPGLLSLALVHRKRTPQACASLA